MKSNRPTVRRRKSQSLPARYEGFCYVDLRHAKHFLQATRKEFAKGLGVSESTLRRWLNGTVAIPDWVWDKFKAPK